MMLYVSRALASVRALEPRAREIWSKKRDPVTLKVRGRIEANRTALDLRNKITKFNVACTISVGPDLFSRIFTTKHHDEQSKKCNTCRMNRR